jgi:hypothetical protein
MNNKPRTRTDAMGRRARHDCVGGTLAAPVQLNADETQLVLAASRRGDLAESDRLIEVARSRRDGTEEQRARAAYLYQLDHAWLGGPK